VAAGRYWHPGKGAPVKAFGYVGNTAHQIAKVLAAPAERVSGRTFYLADDPAYSIRDFAAAIQHEFGGKLIRQLPVPLLRVAAVFGDAAVRLGWKNPPLTTFRLSNMLTGSRFDLRELLGITGKLPFGLVEGVTQTVKWLRTSGAIR
jgi:nucleoside-diphosphate-sugar epimerase